MLCTRLWQQITQFNHSYLINLFVLCAIMHPFDFHGFPSAWHPIFLGIASLHSRNRINYVVWWSKQMEHAKCEGERACEKWKCKCQQRRRSKSEQVNWLTLLLTICWNVLVYLPNLQFVYDDTIGKILGFKKYYSISL